MRSIWRCALVVVVLGFASATRCLAVSTPLFGLEPIFSNGFGAIGFDRPTGEGQFLAQPFALTASVHVGDISLPIWSSGNFNYRLQLVTAVGPSESISVLADATNKFSFTSPSPEGNGLYQRSWINLTVDQDLAPATYYIVMSAPGPEIVGTSPFGALFSIGWGSSSPVPIPGSTQYAEIGPALMASKNPAFQPAFIDPDNPERSLFAPLRPFDRFIFVAYSGEGREFVSSIPEPENWALLSVGLVALMAARRRR